MNRKKTFTAKRMAYDAMLAALCAVLGYIALDLGNIKITFETLPILLGALLFGPLDGVLIGGIGTFIYQVLKYGFSATTALWMLPYIICGLIVGIYAMIKKYSLSKAQTIIIVIVNELLITLLNTAVMYIDSKIYGYYSFAYIFGSFFIRLAVCIVKAYLFGFALPYLTKPIARFIKSGEDFMKSTAYKGSVPGLSRLEALLKELGNPEKKLKYVHVTGTNGKGSVTSMLSAILAEAGYRTGCFQSPAVIDPLEQIKINDECITKEEYASIAEKLKASSKNLGEIPTEFELLTACAIQYFYEKQCDIVVLEAGMGGTLDATNVIPSPVCAVITGVGTEHTAYLGKTLTEIAGHKAGIIKPGTRAVSFNVKDDDVKNVINKRAEETGASLRFTVRENLKVRKRSMEGTLLDYTTSSGTVYTELFLPLAGHYQQKNIRTVLETIDAINEAIRAGELKRTAENNAKKDKDVDFQSHTEDRFASEGTNTEGRFASEGMNTEGVIGVETVVSAIKKVTWPARFEIVKSDPMFILDGGHNPDCILELTKTFDELFPSEKFIFVTGVMADKDYRKMYEMLDKYAAGYICVTPDNPRALSSEKLAEHLLTYGKPVKAVKTPTEGIKLAKSGKITERGSDANAGERIVCVTGSLYMMGEVRKALGLTQ